MLTGLYVSGKGISNNGLSYKQEFKNEQENSDWRGFDGSYGLCERLLPNEMLCE
jgi:hypothetical protein